MPENYVFVEFPKWMYRRGPDGEIESALFNDAASIPEGCGWVGSPATLSVGEANDGIVNRAAAKGRKPKSKASPAGE